MKSLAAAVQFQAERLKDRLHGIGTRGEGSMNVEEPLLSITSFRYLGSFILGEEGAQRDINKRIKVKMDGIL